MCMVSESLTATIGYRSLPSGDMAFSLITPVVVSSHATHNALEFFGVAGM